MTLAAMLSVENVYSGYDKADVLQDVSLGVEAGSITCILGSNGSGKTTLIRAILGLTPPRKGCVVFDGRDLSAMPTHRVRRGSLSSRRGSNRNDQATLTLRV